MSSTRGLGRGLAAILQGGDSTSDTTATSVLGRLVGSVAHGLAAPAPLAVNGYLHLPDDGDADLLLAAPRLADLEPNDVWQVFEAIHQAIDSDADTLGHVLLGVPALTVRTHGPASRGVHVLAGEHLDDATQAVLTRFCRLWSPVVHGFAL
ncbi:MAG: hypothetical protein KDB21_15800, partial [Acidimicrobiales bacterium]|nr:hypothetical protein [Acidimicrobiales bacterium]